MKVILLKDIPKVGKKFEVKDISEGHVMNFLIPKGLVEIANSKSLQKINQMKEKADAERKIQEDLLFKNLDTLKGATIKILGKANEKGHLFAGITKEIIISEIFKQIHLNLEDSAVVLEKPIKEIGEHRVVIQALNKKAEMSVLVEKEK